MSGDLRERVSFDHVRYANCWEDAEVLCAGLGIDGADGGRGKRVLSIASGGDNAFALIASGAEVVAADLSAAQLAVVELKAAAIHLLGYEQVLGFLGVRELRDRDGVYTGLRDGLSEAARVYWDGRAGVIERGVIHAGKFEDYFRLFRTRVLPLVHGRRTVEGLLADKGRGERVAFYKRRWDTWRWRLLFKVFFSRWVMGRLGRDPEFFRYVEGSVSARILDRARYALTELPTHDNPYLMYILCGNFARALPMYLRPGVFERVRDGLDRLTLYRGAIQDAGEAHRGGGFDGFNLSDVFEYLDERVCDELYGALLSVANPGARLAYWNMLVPRSCPRCHKGRVEALSELSRELFLKDGAFFYSAFVVERVVG